MNKYFIQSRLHILAWYLPNDLEGASSFELDGCKFSKWVSNGLGKKSNFWLIEAGVTAPDINSAILDFNRTINPIIAKISFLSQCYCEQNMEPFLIHDDTGDKAFFRYTKDTTGVPLAFDGSSLNGLELLHGNPEINEQFFYYWNDMLNVTGYSAKLLLMCSALEALAKSPLNTQNKYDFFTNVLGEQLKNKIWQNNNVGVRHRLTHGEYFNENTDQENYLKAIYNKVISYFNDMIFKNNCIRHVTNPQRHPNGNKEVAGYFLKRNEDSPTFHLETLVNGFDEGFDNYIDKFDPLPDRDLYPV